MQRKPRRFPALSLVLLILASALHAYGQMKLLSPGVGWVGYEGTVFFTRDNGAHWNNITPHAPGVPRDTSIGSPFFRNESEGWAVGSYQKRTVPTPEAIRNEKMLYIVLHTEDSGKSWSWWPLTYPAQPKWIEDTFAGPAGLFFLDSTHGWMGMTYSGGSHPGKLLATEDGGHTWRWGSSPGFAGEFQFTSLNDGWLVYGWGGNKLFATHNGAKSWQMINLKRPLGVQAMGWPLFSMPHFQNGRGYLAVKYLGPSGIPARLVVYGTESGGRTWRPLNQISVPREATFALVNSTIVLPVETQSKQFCTIEVSASGPEQPSARISGRGVLGFSFCNKNNGWAKTLHGLYATTDGGATWTKISPAAATSRSYGRTVVVHAPPPQTRGHHQ